MLLNGATSTSVAVGGSATMTVATPLNAGLGSYAVNITGMLGTVPKYATALTNITQAAPASIISPVPGALPGGSTTFTWNAGNGATQYTLSLGSAPGGTTYGSYMVGSAQSTTVSVPSVSTVYVTLSSLAAAGWLSQGYVYTVPSAGPTITLASSQVPLGGAVTITPPLNGDTLTGCSAQPGIATVLSPSALTVTVTASAAAQLGQTQIACSTAGVKTVVAPLYVEFGEPQIWSVNLGTDQMDITGANFGETWGYVSISGPGSPSGSVVAWNGTDPDEDDGSENDATVLVSGFAAGCFIYEVQLYAPDSGDTANSSPFLCYEAPPPTVAMKLEQVGPTVISTDGNYTEDTTVRVTAVDATSGETLTGWTGTVNIMEDGTFIYSENDGTLPGSVNITSGGTTTFLARSLAGPTVEGTASAPDPAKLTTPDFPLWAGVDLAIPQWITSGTTIDARAIKPVYDWFQARTAAIFAGYPNDPLVGKIFTSVKNYNAAALTSLLADGGTGGPIGGKTLPATPTQISLNPYYTNYRVSNLIVLNFGCGCTDTNPLPTLVMHEARHTYQYAQKALVTATIPNNDRDNDYLVEAIDTAPTTIFLDNSTFRTVCNEFAPGPQLLSLSYQGDTTYDAPPNSSYSREMDAWVFATMHAGGDTTPPALAIASAHAPSFTQGQTGATITLTVTNLAGFGPASGAVTVTEMLPGGLALVGMTSQDPTWVCNVNSCTRGDPLAGGASYPSITVTVNVAAGATNQLTIANVSGGGSAFAASTTDTIVVVPQ